MAEPRYDCTEAGVKAALDALGDTDEAVAAKLIELGFTGRRDNCKACPVARYLLVAIENAERVEVNDHATVWTTEFDEAMRPSEVSVSVEVPDAVWDFICAFDLGGFPELQEVRNAV